MCRCAVLRAITYVRRRPLLSGGAGGIRPVHTEYVCSPSVLAFSSITCGIGVVRTKWAASKSSHVLATVDGKTTARLRSLFFPTYHVQFVCPRIPGLAPGTRPSYLASPVAQSTEADTVTRTPSTWLLHHVIVTCFMLNSSARSASWQSFCVSCGYG